jgi:hypothetical protein
VQVTLEDARLGGSVTHKGQGNACDHATSVAGHESSLLPPRHSSVCNDEKVLWRMQQMGDDIVLTLLGTWAVEGLRTRLQSSQLASQNAEQVLGEALAMRTLAARRCVSVTPVESST